MIQNEEKYEMVSHPPHYNKYSTETVEMIKRIWGAFAASTWCQLNAFKYRMRLGEKPKNPIEQDLQKENVYIDLYKKYKTIWKNNIPVWSDMDEDEKEYILAVVKKNLSIIKENI